MLSCQGITFLTGICFSTIDQFALLVASNLGDLADLMKTTIVDIGNITHSLHTQ